MSTTTMRKDRVEERRNLLAQHHAYLERRFATLLARAEGGDPAQLRAEWNRFEREISRHLEFEEQELLPAFARDNPDEAAAIRAAHADIRQALLDLGVKLDLHLLRAEGVRAFIRQLAEHARQEERALYPWADRYVSRSRWTALGRKLRRTAGRGGAMLLRELGHVM